MVEREDPAARSEDQPLPTRKPPVLVVMVGPPGTGKSHLVRRLAQRVPVHTVETDEIRRQLTQHPVYTPQEHARVFHVAHRKIDRMLRQGKCVVFDATNLQERGRQIAYRIAESDGARLLIVRTVAPDEVVAERLAKREEGADPTDRSEAGWEVYSRMKTEFEEIRRPHLVVDTARDLDSAVEEIVSFIQGKL